MKKYAAIALVILSAAFVLGRFFQPAHTPTLPDVYKDAAHLFVGGLLFGGCVAKGWLPSSPNLYFGLAAVLCVVEVLVFVVGRL